MTSTRSTIPAPPPNGVSSTCPHLNGVDARKSTASTEWPRLKAFSTCRWVRNQSNQCGNSVKTSAFTEEAQVDVDPARLDVDRADAVAHHRDQQLGTVGAIDLEHLDRRECAHPAHETDDHVAVDDRAAGQIRGPVLVLLKGSFRARDGQLVPAQGVGVVARGRAL